MLTLMAWKHVLSSLLKIPIREGKHEALFEKPISFPCESQFLSLPLYYQQAIFILNLQ